MTSRRSGMQQGAVHVKLAVGVGGGGGAPPLPLSTMVHAVKAPAEPLVVGGQTAGGAGRSQASVSGDGVDLPVPEATAVERTVWLPGGLKEKHGDRVFGGPVGDDDVARCWHAARRRGERGAAGLESRWTPRRRRVQCRWSRSRPATARCPWTAAGKPTLTVELASLAVAAFCQAAVMTAQPPVRVPSTLHPAGAVSGLWSLRWQ